jgi:hypothetical protein
MNAAFLLRDLRLDLADKQVGFLARISILCDKNFGPNYSEKIGGAKQLTSQVLLKK